METTPLPNHTYIDLNLVGEEGGVSVRCRTDLDTCCTGAQGIHRGDWIPPDGEEGMPLSSNTSAGIYQVQGAQRVILRRRNNADIPSGIYCCNIATIAVHDDNDIVSVRESVYVGLYATGGDITISDNITLTVNSDLNGASPQFTLTCISTGGPATTVTWTRDSDTVTEGNETVLDDPVTAQYTHTLTVTGRLGGVYTCTVANYKPSSDSAQLKVQDSLFQIRLIGLLTTCSEFVSTERNMKLEIITSAVLHQLTVSCTECGVTRAFIDTPSFACFPESPTSVTYRARLLGTDSLISLIEEWVSGGAGIIMTGVLVTVDSECPVAISSLGEGECQQPPTTEPTTKPTTTPTNTRTTTEPTTSSDTITDTTSASTDSASSDCSNTAAIIGGIVLAAILIISVAVTVIMVTLSVKNRCGNVSLNKIEENVVDLSMSAHKGGALTTTTNPAYEIMKQGGQGSHENELVGVSPGTAPPIADKTYEMPSPPSHQPLPVIPLSVAPPTGGNVGVAKEGEEEGVYDNIPGDQ